jgi:hypothetical protein
VTLPDAPLLAMSAFDMAPLDEQLTTQSAASDVNPNVDAADRMR